MLTTGERMDFFQVIIAIVAAALTIGIAWVLPLADGLYFVSLILAVTAGVYLGFAFLDGRIREQLIETAGVILFVALALLGLRYGAWIIAAGFFLHIFWDLVHHERGIQTKIVSWYVSACLVYDGLLAIFILYRFP